MYNKKNQKEGGRLVSRLYLYANIIYEMSLYLLILGSYLNWEGVTLFLLTILMIISVLITGAPSTYHFLNYEISESKTNLDGYFKFGQIFILLGLFPELSEKYIPFAIFLLIIISLVGIKNRSAIYKQIKHENIESRDFFRRINEDTSKNKELEELLGIAWRTILPLFLLGFLEIRNIGIAIFVVILVLFLEVLILRKFYFKLVLFTSNKDFKKDFIHLLARSFLILVFLLTMSLLDSESFFNYILMGFYTTQFLDFVHRERYIKAEITSLS